MTQMTQTYLGEFEHLVLLAVLRLGEEAYAVPIREALATHSGRAVARGALYTTLDRLEQKQLLRSTLGDALPERGGRPRRYYTVTQGGLASLRAARAAIDNLSRGVSLDLAK
jgi:PadR family transcriptional regulator, regulatory protein PadR